MPFSNLKALSSMIAEYNEILNKKGIFLTVLQIGGERAMVYVYRKSHLKRDLKKPCVKCILRRFGYSNFTVTAAINVLKIHLKSFDEFPHEIGLFLGYPPEDVAGFIENKGRNFIHCGCWKVYCDKCEAVKTFTKYKKCRQVYCRLWKEGVKTVRQLTVSA